MNAFVGFLLLIASILLQSTGLEHISLGGQRIDLTLLVVISFAIVRGGWAGFFWGAIAGLFLDTISILPFGSHTIALALITTIVGLSLRQLTRDYPMLPFVALPVIVPAFYLLMGASAWALGWPSDGCWPTVGQLLSAIVLDTIALPFVYVPVYTINKRARVEINWQPGRS